VPTVGRKGLKLKRKYFMHSLSSEFANSKAFGLKRLRAYKFNIIKRESYSSHLLTYGPIQPYQFIPLSCALNHAAIHMYWYILWWFSFSFRRHFKNHGTALDIL
jgi:hypothetical protein